MRFVRFRSADAGPRGIYIGVFGLVNTLAKQGRLAEDEESFRRQNNDWYDANYTNPSEVDQSVYDHDVNPALSPGSRNRPYTSSSVSMATSKSSPVTGCHASGSNRSTRAESFTRTPTKSS